MEHALDQVVRVLVDLKGSVGSLTVYDDYAHHPTEIETTLRAANNRFDAEIIVIFQPHRYTRTRNLAEEFGPALKEADRLLVTDVYPAGEDPIAGIDMQFLERTIQPHRNGHVTAYKSENEKILNWVESQIEPHSDQVVFTMGAGNVVDLAEPILELERSRQRH
ncbi:MAG: glutamate ligase domain-containing protein [Haloplanus sp.]